MSFKSSKKNYKKFKVHVKGIILGICQKSVDTFLFFFFNEKGTSSVHVICP